MAFNVQTYFNTTLPAVLAKNGPIVISTNPRVKQKQTLDCLVQVVITGSTGGTWYLDFTHDPPTCTSGGPGSPPDLTLTMVDTAFEAFMTNPAQGLTSFILAKTLTLSGNAMLFVPVQTVFTLS